MFYAKGLKTSFLCFMGPAVLRFAVVFCEKAKKLPLHSGLK